MWKNSLIMVHVILMGFFFVFRDATVAYKAEALELQKQLRHLQSQFDMLTGQASALIQGRRARVAATSAANGHLTTIDDSLSGRNLQVSKSSESLITLNIWNMLCSNLIKLRWKVFLWVVYAGLHGFTALSIKGITWKFNIKSNPFFYIAFFSEDTVYLL